MESLEPVRVSSVANAGSSIALLNRATLECLSQHEKQVLKSSARSAGNSVARVSQRDTSTFVIKTRRVTSASLLTKPLANIVEPSEMNSNETTLLYSKARQKNDPSDGTTSSRVYSNLRLRVTDTKILGITS